MGLRRLQIAVTVADLPALFAPLIMMYFIAVATMLISGAPDVINEVYKKVNFNVKLSFKV